MTPAAAILALSTPLQEQAILVGTLMVGIGIVVGIVAGMVSIYANLRRRPSADETFATKQHLAEVEAKFDRSIKALETRVETHLEAFERRITADITTNRSHTEHRFGEMSAKFDALTNTMGLLSNDLMRAVGRIEGKIATPV